MASTTIMKFVSMMMVVSAMFSNIAATNQGTKLSTTTAPKSTISGGADAPKPIIDPQKPIGDQVVNALKPKNLQVPGFLTLSYYVDFLRSANDKVARVTGINVWNMVATIIGWFVALINVLRGLLILIPDPRSLIRSATSTP